MNVYFAEGLITVYHSDGDTWGMPIGQGLCDAFVEVWCQGRGVRSAQWDLRGLRLSGVAEEEDCAGEQHFRCEFADN